VGSVAVDAMCFWMVGYEKFGPTLLTVQIYAPANVKTLTVATDVKQQKMK